MAQEIRPSSARTARSYRCVTSTALAGVVLTWLDRVRHPGARHRRRATYEDEPAVGAVTRVVDLPKRTTELPEQYVLESAYHGMAMNASGTTLCAAGTMDGYAAIVGREPTEFELVDVGDKPYWATDGRNGEECWVSVSGEE
jgi:hypothetical protein